MVEEILPNFFRAQIPLPDSPLKFLNSYLVKGQPRNLIVDTGLNRDECRQAMADAVRSVGMDLTDTDFVITHAHADHIGIAKEISGSHSKVFLGEPDAALLSRWTSWEGLFPVAAAHGFPQEELAQGIQGNRNMAFRAEDVPKVALLEEGQTFSVGEYCFEAMATPGHSPGHTCLYERRQRILLSGDHILDEISPNITSWRPGNPLRAYLASLQKVAGLEVDYVLPGHRSPFRDLRRRIRELQDHHAERLDDVLSLLGAGAQTPYELASKMKWDLAGSWARWAFTQRWFALGEAMSHLRYLEAEGLVGQTERDGLIRYLRR